jgi:hypothetical protein
MLLESALLTEKDVADHLQVSLSKLRLDRFYKRGLPYIKISRTIRYSPKQIDAYFSEHTVLNDSGKI